LRIEPHHFEMQALIAPYRQALVERLPLTRPFVEQMANGVNLAEAAYALEESDPEYLYASVGAISLYVLREERAIPLQPPDDFEYLIDLDQAQTRPSEVLVTRSGATGVAGSAWAAALAPPGKKIIPSGFVIRIQCDPSVLEPRYLAAILNHPIWRAWSNSLTAGKEQRNLSQEHLRDLRVPRAEISVQAAIASDYAETLNAIRAELDERQTTRDTCDAIVIDVCGLRYPTFAAEAYSVASVPIAQIGATGLLRIDPRHHQPAVRAVTDALLNEPTLRLADLLAVPAFKGRQPEMDVVDDGSEIARTVATVSVQAGQIVPELTKLARSEWIANLGDAALRVGDVVITMDGEGSIGRAAVHTSDLPMATDSHVGVLRLIEPDLGPGLCCYLNSSLAQAQIELSISGSTGQTQLSKSDLDQLKVPTVIVDQAAGIGERFAEVVGTYEVQGQRIRRMFCEHAARTSESLISAGTFSGLKASDQRRLTDAAELRAILERVRDSTL
jgi:hypothetical protein